MFEELNAKIIEWAEERSLLTNNSKMRQLAQFSKTLEEVAELGTAIVKEDDPEIVDALGDIVVTLILQAELQGVDLTVCLASAYDVIAKRKGQTVNGVFIKDATRN